MFSGPDKKVYRQHHGGKSIENPGAWQMAKRMAGTVTPAIMNNELNFTVLSGKIKTMDKPLLIYCYDAYCGWCYGFSPVIRKLCEQFHDKVQTEVVSGGMLRGDTAIPIEQAASFLTEACTRVERTTGVSFGTDFLWHVRNPRMSDWTMDSTLPAIALCVFRDYFPDLQIEFATALQQALFDEGRDLCDKEAYRNLLLQFRIPPDAFIQKMNEERYRILAEEDFRLCQQLKVSGFPALYLQESEQKVHQLCCGYLDYDQLASKLDNALNLIAHNP